MRRDNLRKEYDKLFIKYAELDLSETEEQHINKEFSLDKSFEDIEIVENTIKSSQGSLDDRIIGIWDNLSYYGKALVLSKGYYKKNRNVFIETFYKLKSYHYKYWGYYHRSNYHILNKRKVYRYKESEFMRKLLTQKFINYIKEE